MAKTKRKGAARTPPYPPYPEWSSAKFFSFIRSGLRSKFQRWPPKWEILKKSSAPYTGDIPRLKTVYQCAECQQWYKQADVEVDHIAPCGSLKCFEDLPGFVERMFVGPEGLRVVCKPCHLALTKASRSKE